MGIDDLDDYECEGQISLWDLGSVDIPENIFAVSKIFARARKQMSLAELKTFVYALTHFRFRAADNPPTMMLDKKTLANIVGVHADPDHLSANLKRVIKDLPSHSYVEFDVRDLDYYECGFVISKLRMYKDNVWIKFDEDYLKLFTQLDKDYITMWSSDIYQMRSERSITMYEDLRLNSDTRTVNTKGYGVKALKQMFGIPMDGKGSYTRENGHLNRSEFEKYVIDPVCQDLARCKMIHLIVQDDGKYYDKVKRGSRVLGYRLYWTVSTHPAVASAEEVKQIQDRVDKDPRILKIAKDIVDGKSKPCKNQFNAHPQQTYDFDALEKLISNH